MQSSEKRICPNCGAPNDPNATFCANCGKSLTQTAAPPPVAAAPQYPQYQPPPQYQPVGGQYSQPMPPPMPMERPLGVTIIGIFQIIGAVIVLLFSALFTAYSPILGVIFLPVGIITLVFAIALFTGHNWARILMLISAVLYMLTIVGIPWGVILFIYFRRRNVVAYFNRNKQPPLGMARPY